MNKYFKINGGNKLEGTIKIKGAKNSVLPLMIGTTIANDKFQLRDIPNIKDVEAISAILEKLNSKVAFEDDDKEVLIIDNTDMEYKELMYESVSQLRASYYFIGALLGKYGKVKILLPGGCFLGERPIDLHIKGFESLGCDVVLEQTGNFESIEVTARDGKLHGEHIFLDFPSVGATINIMLAAAQAEGITILENAAKEPEIVNVAMLLNKMGAKIRGAGTQEIRIEGVSEFKGCSHTVIPDRIEAGTYILYGALLSDNLTVDNIIPEHLEALFSKLKEIGIKMEIRDDSVTLLGKGENLKPVKITTGVHPSFPTDLQQIMTTLLTQIEGKSEVEDTIYPERFRNCDYLNKMGADIDVKEAKEESGKCKINGGQQLKGAEVIATDLRAGAGLIFAGLLADGETRVEDINHILRGYDEIIHKLTAVGADIELVEEGLS